MTGLPHRDWWLACHVGIGQTIRVTGHPDVTPVKVVNATTADGRRWLELADGRVLSWRLDESIEVVTL